MSELATTSPHRTSLIAKIAERYSVDPAKLAATLKATAFRTERGATDEQLMSLLIVSDQYKLNPFTKELFAFPDKGGIVPVVSVDGWARIINEHPMFDGVAFSYDRDERAYTCTMYRKDRAHPTVITEYASECERGTPPWKSHPLRMLRHKALIQCARIAFGFAGIYDEDEAQRIVHMGKVQEVKPEPVSTSADKVRHFVKKKPEPELVQEVEPQQDPEQSGPDVNDFIAGIEEASDAEVARAYMEDARALFGPADLERIAEALRAKWGD